MNYLKPKPLWMIVLGWVLVGCTLQGNIPVTVVVLAPTPTSTMTATPPHSPTPAATPMPFPWEDARAAMSGICFEAALDDSGQTIVIRSAEDHIRYYDNVDSSNLCRRAVRREPFEFADGARTLAGLWSYGTGCDAAHEVTDYAITDDVLTITLDFVTNGDCNYELIQPFWIGAEGVTDVQIVVDTPTP